MNTCETCKFWTPNTLGGDFGSCNSESLCYESDISTNEKKGLTVLAFYGDSESYNAWFGCKKDFGCVLHQTKEEEKK